MTPVQLPEVPAPVSGTNALIGGYTVWVAPASNYYTAAQLREYATEAVMAERARIAGQTGSVIREAVFGNFDRVSSSQYVLITGPSTIVLSAQKAIAGLLSQSETNSG